MSQLLLAFVATLAGMSAVGAAPVAASGINIVAGPNNGAFTLTVDGAEWISGGGTPVTVMGRPLTLLGTNTTEGSDKYGHYHQLRWDWATATEGVVLSTDVRSYVDRELAIFTQTWPNGWDNKPAPGPPPSPPPPPPGICSEVKRFTDQDGGREFAHFDNTSDAACCAKCLAEPGCNVWVTDPYNPGGPDCWLVEGYTGSHPRSNRNAGFVRKPTPTPSPIIAAFPSFNASSGAAMTELKYLSWGGCQVAQVRSGNWSSVVPPKGITAGAHPSFDGVHSGEPLVLHNAAGRTIVISPMDNFFVTGQALTSGALECGVRTTVEKLPAKFSASTVLVGGHGINATMVSWGDLLLDAGDKKRRTDPYDDFVLSHLGYWTDNGAYYYHQHYNFTNAEEALKAVKADLSHRAIPVRYFQWDDWWMEGKGDVPGITSWTPKSDVFPSGFTNWLNTSLSMYAPMYSGENDWVGRYKWKLDPKKPQGGSAIPLDASFYKDLFSNGTRIGMKMFEQDFLCTYNGDTGLTNTDTTSGAQWMAQMHDAAAATNNSLQWCMMNPMHALHSTLVPSMTNGRATGDNCRGDSANIRSMGQNGLLYYSLGFFPSRDNVWTTSANVEQVGCNRYCFEPSRQADNAVAVLGGGPYGPSDGVGLTDRTTVMYACRDDGVMLRPSWPLSSLDVTFTREQPGPGNNHWESDMPLVWAAHDDHGPMRWSYVLGINLASSFTLRPHELQGASSGSMVAWQVILGSPPTAVTVVDEDHPLNITAASAQKKGPGLSHWTLAPVLPNGMAVLGDTSKWATMSTRRITSFQANHDSVSAEVVGAKGEMVQLSYVVPASGTPSAVKQVWCNFSFAECKQVKHGDTDCVMTLGCAMTSCKCA